jgi:ribonuclease HI
VSTWHVWTDGSCHHGVAQTPKGEPGYGGWAAIVEHGNDGRVLRGRAEKTTNVRMELTAAIEGLRAVPAGGHVVLHTDSTVIVSVKHCRRSIGASRADAELWQQLADEFGRVDVEIQMVVRGERDPVHKRAHVIAGAEARAGLRNLPFNAVPLDEAHRHIRKGMRRRAVRAWIDEPRGRSLRAQGLA